MASRGRPQQRQPRPIRPQGRPIDVNNIFIEVYRAYPASMMGRSDIDITNSIILPPSALQKLSVMKNFGDSKNPIRNVYSLWSCRIYSGRRYMLYSFKYV